jgi:Flp pilus assembly protein TadD
MPRRSGLFAAVAVPALGLALTQAPRPGATPAPPPTPRSAAPSARASLEAAYRANNVGVGLLEQFRHEEAAASFRRALALAPGLALAHANLAIALLNVPKIEEARAEARVAIPLLPGVAQPQYVLGLAARGLGAAEEAQAAFRAVIALDGQDVGARVNLGQLLLQDRRYPEAIEQLRAAVAAEPFNATAVYNLGLALVRSGQADEGQRAMERFRALKESGYGTLLANAYPEQGRYAEALASTGAEPDLVDAATPPVQLVDATARWLPSAPASAPAAGPGGLTLADVDGDGRLDLVSVGPGGLRLYLNDGGRLVDATLGRGLDPALTGAGVVAADVDNDTRPDLLVLGPSGPRLYHNDGARFADVTAGAGLESAGPALSAALVDADHDGDLDILLAATTALDGRALPHRLFQNDGTARFKDVAAAAGLGGAATAGVAVVPTDFDNHRDVDLLVAGPRAVQLFQNQRDGTFRDVAAAVGLGAVRAARSVTTGDLNQDDVPDLVFAVEGGPAVVAMSNGKGGFAPSDLPEAARDARQVLVADYDGDGLLDLLVLRADGLRVLRNLGGGAWADVTAAAVPAASAARGAAGFAAGDLDGDGHTDVVLRMDSGDLRILENHGRASHALTVRLAGLVSNRSGVGSKVTLRAGSLRERLETSAATPPAAPADLVFGLGPRTTADAVRILWPAGILQTELPAGDGATATPAAVARLEVKELDRKPSSCPFLYAWNGRALAFVTDFMGGGEMGYWEGPGEYNHPDPDEYVRLADDQLRPREGRLELRVTNELEEALFVDRLSLLAVDHPGDVEVYPDEGMRQPAPRFRLVGVRDPHPVAAATDERGGDVSDRLARRDRRFVDGFPLRRIRGYAGEHALTLDLGPGDDTVLLLTGWTDYAFSTDNVAARQAGFEMKAPVLQVEDAAGAWTTVIDDLGIPVGRPQTLAVEMAGRWRSAARRVRIVTNMRIYWDQARVGTRAALAGVPARLEAVRADLHERGFSAEVSPDGREPFGYDYARVSVSSPWKAFPGRYTRTGDVRELLAAVDDLFVISKPGDEIALSFDAGALPPLGPGRRRTYLLHSDGFSKEMDLHSATPDVLGPLPFHGMTRYPYAAPEAYPMTPARARVMEAYNTRVVRSVEGPLTAQAR